MKTQIEHRGTAKEIRKKLQREFQYLRDTLKDMDDSEEVLCLRIDLLDEGGERELIEYGDTDIDE